MRSPSASSSQSDPEPSAMLDTPSVGRGSGSNASIDLLGQNEINFDSLNSIPKWLRRIVQRIFWFYSGADSTCANTGAGLGLTRFRRFLRDCELMSAGEVPETCCVDT